MFQRYLGQDAPGHHERSSLKIRISTLQRESQHLFNEAERVRDQARVAYDESAIQILTREANELEELATQQRTVLRGLQGLCNE